MCNNEKNQLKFSFHIESGLISPTDETYTKHCMKSANEG